MSSGCLPLTVARPRRTRSSRRCLTPFCLISGWDHSIRVSMLAQAMAEEMRLSKEEVNTVRIAGLVHDIGKIGISEVVLRKTGKLTSEEWLDLKRHPNIGAEIISAVPSLAAAVPG